MQMFVRMCGSSTLWVRCLSTWSWLGLPGWHRDHLVREHRAPFEALKQGRLGMINGPAEWHAPRLSLRPAASSPAALPPDTASSVTAPFVHTTRFPQCHLPDLPPVPPPPLPPKSIKELCSGGISSFGWYHPPCCAVDTGVVLLEDKGNDWQLDQLSLNKVLILIRTTLTATLQELSCRFWGMWNSLKLCVPFFKISLLFN